jgi:hypothetical protein
MDPVQVLWTAQLITEIGPNMCSCSTARRRGPPRNDRGADATVRPCLDSADHAGIGSLRTRRWREPDSNLWSHDAVNRKQVL